MRGVLSLLGIVIALAIGMFIYRSNLENGAGKVATMGTNNPRAVADVTGVKNDLLAMAQAERARMALDGKYASLEDLVAKGDLSIDPSRGRAGYTYSADITDQHFTITASYSGPATGMPTLYIDPSMEVHSR